MVYTQDLAMQKNALSLLSFLSEAKKIMKKAISISSLGVILLFMLFSCSKSPIVTSSEELSTSIEEVYSSSFRGLENEIISFRQRGEIDLPEDSENHEIVDANYSELWDQYGFTEYTKAFLNGLPTVFLDNPLLPTIAEINGQDIPANEKLLMADLLGKIDAIKNYLLEDSSRGMAEYEAAVKKCYETYLIELGLSLLDATGGAITGSIGAPGIGTAVGFAVGGTIGVIKAYANYKLCVKDAKQLINQQSVSPQ
ncbi:hypothetical protein [Porphyromonas loveana]|uniref:Uncharacterized protein n=1 Tax=Porphyromonas loveana TaxID=1884669 RepID=A0A2U1FEY8_9PORP|nr:hypothetical protein [Porphyromonas loveana]PVZ10781.1 hypothetical protein C7382_107147 [Porphyromonas loveana]